MREYAFTLHTCNIKKEGLKFHERYEKGIVYKLCDTLLTHSRQEETMRFHSLQAYLAQTFSMDVYCTIFGQNVHRNVHRLVDFEFTIISS